MKNIHILPTNKPSRLSILNNGKLNFGAEFISSSNTKAKHTYITNDEEIKEGDYGVLGESILSYHQMHKKWGMPQGKKIILTTDADLVKDGVQAIDDEFLEWFVKNPSCEEVEVKKSFADGSTFGYGYIENLIYKIIIPKQETKQETHKEIAKQVEIESQELSKQETLEEAADRYFPFAEKIGGETYTAYRGFKAGAKWQQERMYSEEIVDILDNVRYWETCPNSYKVIIEKFIEQNKIK